MAVSRLFSRPRALPPPTSISSRHLRLSPISHASQARNPQTWRTFSSSAGRHQKPRGKESFRSRLGTALKGTKIEWYWLPATAGIAFVGGLQSYRMYATAKAKEEEADNASLYSDDGEPEKKPKKRKRTRPSGPWQVQIMSTLPLKALSRAWGWFNSCEIPYYLRVPGFKLYAFIFGVNLNEVAEPDLHAYRNLAEFFYRELKPGSRPLDPNPNAVLSPADGKVIQFGAIEHGEVEQVKGVTYSLDALLGTKAPTAAAKLASSSRSPSPSPERSNNGDEEHIKRDEEFARINGISYTLPNLLSGSPDKESKSGIKVDQSTPSKPTSEAEVRADLALSERPWWAPRTTKTPTQLYYVVIYLAPGDYHRFHSPVSWVVTSRRHFAGELYSVSPYLQRTLPGLFTLNERVVLLGRWRWGFFSYTPVGATNVGSIVINFDKELRTNSLLTDTAADRAAEEAAARGEPYSGFSEATYENASAILGGHALKRGEEMGGFQLGSTIVLVFEAPKGRRTTSFDEGYSGVRQGGWRWCIEKGMKVKVGQALGEVLEDTDKSYW
ncbi:phosphatidylserine decarboxylase [Verruconis gallopava]|uniref:Phosphatidylserine decarboxylase proenzyme 1, mitochondrial n=1 Tax=Verruconis gallopava TaxID=253628 RepID=A0A0D1YW75_9PEZI|nr:phosphatidylserine decarboxylase [Verruconis gallopava]KIW04937.1 phosphatidylserine decarboxylase [Verruconis gallopava]